MSNDTPTTGSHDQTEPEAPPTTPDATATPAEPEPLREPEPTSAPAAAEPTSDSTWAPSNEPAPEPEPVPAAAAEPASTETAEPTPAPTPAPTVVYVDPPARPKKRGTRGVGIAVVLLATGIFTILYALATIILALALRPDGLNGFVEYLASAPFLVPVAVFAGAHLLLVLIANRAGWWMHVLGGFLVAVLVWVAFLGAAVIAAGALGAPAGQQQALLLQQAVNPLGILAAVLAREIPIWVGGIVARRGRTQAAKNAEAQEAYERDLAAHRASVAPQAPTR